MAGNRGADPQGQERLGGGACDQRPHAGVPVRGYLNRDLLQVGLRALGEVLWEMHVGRPQAPADKVSARLGNELRTLLPGLLACRTLDNLSSQRPVTGSS